MKKFVLNILNVLAWIFEILFGITAIVLVISSIISLVPNWRNQVAVKAVTGLEDKAFAIFIILLLLAVMFAALGWTVRSIRLIIRNIKREVYFDQANLNLLHTTLVSLGIFTIVDIIEACISGFVKMKSDLRLDFSNAVYSLIILGIIYVIYLVFKNGLKLQEDSNKII